MKEEGGDEILKLSPSQSKICNLKSKVSMGMKILFLDQTGKLGGAELSLLEIARQYRETSLVGLFEDGLFRQALEQQQVPVNVLANRSIQVRKDSGLWQSLGSLGQLLPLVYRVAQLSRSYDLIYTNTQKALVVGALASAISRCPMVYHLRDILSVEHFSRTNRGLAISLANRFAVRVIANSEATRAAFIEAGGRADLVQVIYNGFELSLYDTPDPAPEITRRQLELNDRFVVGHFSRLSPWKGQHILIEALAHCPDNVVAILVGDALFGEQDYVKQLHQQVKALGLSDRVQFLGFRKEVISLIAACDLVAHTSTAPEPFGRVIVEAMLCGTPVVAADAGGAVELVSPGKTGWLTPPGDVLKLASVIQDCQKMPEKAAAIAHQAQIDARERFDTMQIQQQIQACLQKIR